MCIIMSMMIIIINQFERPNTRVLHPVESSASSIATTPRTVEAKPCIGVLVTEAFFFFFFFFFSLVAVFLLYEFSSFLLRFCANGIDVSSWKLKPLCRRGACGVDRHLCVVGVGGVHWLEGCE